MAGKTPKDAIGFLCEDIKSTEWSWSDVVHLALILELFSKRFYLREGIRHGNTDIYPD